METQDTISEWADVTFGSGGTISRVLARALEEMAELIRAITAGKPREEIAEEIADVAIILYRAATRLGFDADAASYSFASERRMVTLSVLACGNLLQALRLCDEDAEGGSRYCLYMTFANLRSLMRLAGFNWHEQIDRKMQINRRREWRSDGTGHGYHVRQREVAHG